LEQNRWEAAYHRQIETVYRLCYAMLGNPHDAQDAAQSVFETLMRKAPPFADSEHEKAWCIVTARNRCRDMRRRFWRKREQSFVQAAQSPADEGVFALLAQLSPEKRAICYLHYYEGYTLAEISALLHVNPNTIKTRLRAARQQLRLLWEEENE